MVKTSTPAVTRDVLVAIGDLLVKAEPILLHLWKDSRLTLGSLRVLRALTDAPQSAGELALVTGCTPPTMARLLGRLEERGFVERAIDTADRRRIEVRLTDAGRELLNRTHVLTGGPFERAAAELPPEVRADLVESLGRFAALVRP